MVLGYQDNHMPKKLNTYLTTHIKINSKCINNLVLELKQ